MFNLQDILLATDGNLIRGKNTARIPGVSIDSRTLKRGDLFIAIKGKNFDGHDFIKEVIKKSASAIIVSRRIHFPAAIAIPVILVTDTIKALGQIARFHRNRFPIPIVAITGSAGKTTTKEMVASVLGTEYSVLKNAATENNNIGVPLTLFKLNKSHEVAVVELGTNHFGEMRWLSKITNPTVAVFLNIAESHLEFLESLSGVFKEKFELVKNMSRDGCVIFNNDDHTLRKIAKKKIKQRLMSFGIETTCHYRANQICMEPDSTLRFRVNKREIIYLKTPARHNIYNALAAISCGRFLNISYANIRKALREFDSLKGRFSLYKIKQVRVIDDSYNANPLSLRSAIQTLDNLKIYGRRILVCADMLELGRYSRELHRSVGKFVADSQIDSVFTVGKLSRLISETAKRNRYLYARHYDSVAAAQKGLKQYLRPGDTLLLKGSRAMRMERILAFLQNST